jgi:DNA repair photolyase
MDLIKDFGQYWYITITPYGKDIEPGVPDKAKVMESFKQLSNMVGVDRIGWRYDPIFIDEKYTVDFHLEAFAKMSANLRGYTNHVVISFIDIYDKVKRNFPKAAPVSAENKVALGQKIIEIARANDMVVKPCAEGDFLAKYGADCSGCMTVAMYEDAIGERLKVPRQAPARKECACYLGGDIGAYNTCGHLCRYCYANYDAETVRQNMRKHDPLSPLLIGHLMPGDTVHEAKQESWIDRQMRLV